MERLKYKIGIVDDHQIFREVLSEKLNQYTNLEVVAQFGTGTETLKFLQANEVDVLLLDIDLPDENGIDLISQCLELRSDLKIIMMSMYNDSNTKLKCIKSGARSYLCKDDDLEGFLFTINRVLDKGVYFSDDLNLSLIGHFKIEKLAKKEISRLDLSKRELEIIALIAKEKTAKEISSILKIEIKTIEAHKTKIMQKLNVKSSVGICIKSIQLGIIE